MINYLTLKEASIFLKLKDIRSAEKWCRINNVKIITAVGSKIRYVIKLQFEKAHDKPIIDYFKMTNKNNWEEMYEAYLKEDIIKIIELEDGVKQRQRSQRYVPNGELERKFLEELTKSKAA